MAKDTNRKMWLLLLMCVTVLIGCVTCGAYPEEDNQDARVEDQCNRQIPEDRSVSVGEECASSQNCQQVNAECVEVRSGYCECKVVEERMTKKWKRKWINKKKKYCKKREGHSCSRKSKCQKKYRKREKKCRHPGRICCTKCKNLEDYDCVPKRECAKGYAKEWYQCAKRSEVCCKKEEKIECQSGALYEYCEPGRCECSVTNSACSSGECQCKPDYAAVDGACEPVKNYDEPCKDTVQCIEDNNVCNHDTGKCDCNIESVRDGTTCEKKYECYTDGRCVAIYSNPTLERDAAKQACIDQNARLVVIEDSAFQAFVWDQLKKHCSDCYAYIGLTKVGSEFHWDDGRQFTQLDPADGFVLRFDGEGCVYMNHHDGKFADFYCSWKRQYICERPAQ